MVVSPWRVVLLVLLAASSAASATDAPAPPKSSTWAGIYPTIVTPYRGAYGGVDVAALEHQLEHVIKAGVHGLVVCDSFGEGEYLTPQERGEVMQTAVRHAFPRIPVIVGIQTCDVAEARRQAMEARRVGAAGVLVKYTGKPNAGAAEVYQFMRGVCEYPVLPTFYDHCPSRTGVDLGTNEVAQLLALPGMVGIREAPAHLPELVEHVKLCQGMGRVFFSATALHLTQFLAAGGVGAMCPEAVLLPAPCVKAFRAYAVGRHEEAEAIQEEINTLAPIFRLKPTLPILERVAYATVQDFKLVGPSGQEEPQAQMKAALTSLGIATPTWVKMPLPPLSSCEQHCVSSTVTTVKKIDWCEVSMRAAPVPAQASPGSRAGGMLLKTGAFQLGAGVGKDLLDSQDDGHSGFFH
jgi:dihydrodipicolinate synthase/N-acetylneuraminate lyase